MTSRTFARLCMISILWCLVVGVAPATDSSDRVVRGDGFAVAVPEGWRLRKDMQPTMPLFCGGDGIGVPPLDETGSPLQIGMTVEHWPQIRKPLDERRKIQTDSVADDTRLQPVGEPIVESITLDDGTGALLMTFEFAKEKRRHSLQIKLLANAPDGTAWCSSGFLVGGVESKWPTANSELAKWLIPHVRSFCFDAEKMDQTKLPGPFAPAEQQP